MVIKTTDIDRACINKKRYRQAGYARSASKRYSKRFGVKMRPYLCVICGGFHLTSKSIFDKAEKGEG
jgi:hypothetical protein